MLTRFIRRFPTLAASSFYAVATALVFFPVWLGRVLLSEGSDQRTGYAFREFAADYIRAHGEIPQWNPYLLGGMPFEANTMHGDTVFPTALLRLLLPVDVGMAVGFAVFIFLAGLFAFLFLRAMRLSWGASFVGGSAYMLSGMLVSMVSPGHDGKLYVSALLPLALLFLYRAALRSDWREYLYFGVTIGFSLLTPHYQATYCLLMGAGFFWLFLTFFADEKPAGVPWWRSALLFAGSLGLAFAVAAIQVLPFFASLPLSARGAAGEAGAVANAAERWAYATSYAMPPLEILNTIWPTFSGTSMLGTYWGSNPIKLHSEYLGAGAMLLALLAHRLTSHRKLAWFFAFLLGYAVLFSLGGATPFYLIPYNLLPKFKDLRAPAIIFFLASLCVSVFAAFGTEALSTAPARTARQDKKEKPPLLEAGLPRGVWIALAVLGGMCLLAASGALKSLMLSEAGARGADAVERGYPMFMSDTLRVLIVGLAVAALMLPKVRSRLAPELWAVALGAVVLVDLWSAERGYIRFSPRAAEIFPADEVVSRLRSDSSLFRVAPLPDAILQSGWSYTTNYLSQYRIRSTLGYNGNELAGYDRLLGGKGALVNTIQPRLLQLLGVKYFLSPVPLDSTTPAAFQPLVASLEPAQGPFKAWDGTPVFLYRLRDPQPYALLVPHAWRVDADPEQVIETLLRSTQMGTRSLLLLPKDAPVGDTSQPPASALSDRIDVPVSAVQEREGHLVFDFASPAPRDAFLYVAENYHPDWKATVDGAATPVVRAQYAFMAVPVPAGARHVTLDYESAIYRQGRLISLIAVLLVIVAGIAGRRTRHATGPDAATPLQA